METVNLITPDTEIAFMAMVKIHFALMKYTQFNLQLFDYEVKRRATI
jgi:hypothetical protein